MSRATIPSRHESWRTATSPKLAAHGTPVLPTLHALLWRHRLLLVIAALIVLAAATVYHYLIFLPRINHPTKLFLVDVIFELAIAGLIMTSATIVGMRVMRLVPHDSVTRLEAGLLSYGLGTGLLALATAGLGLLHAYYFPVLLVELLAPLVIWPEDVMTLARGLVPSHPRFALGELRPRSVYESAMFAVMIVIGAILFEHTIVPFWGFDVFMYHFALPQRFLELHQLFGSPGIPQANLPYNNEMLNLLALNFNAEIGAAAIQASFVLATCLAIFALGVRLLTRRAAWLGMAIFLATPVVVYYASSGLIDEQFAFMSLLAIIALLEYRDQRARSWLAIAGLVIGLGIGVKYQIVYLIGPMVVPLLWWSRPTAAEIARQPRRGALLAWVWQTTVNFAIVGGCALAAFALWPIREWVQVGNPIYPLVWGGAQWTAARMAYYKSQFDNFGSLRHTLTGRVAAIFDWYWHWQRYDYTPLPPARAVGLAPLAGFFLLDAPRDAAQRRRRDSALLLLWLCLASLALWAYVDQLVPRYVLPTFGLLALLAGLVIDEGVHWATRVLSMQGRDVVFAVVGCLALVPGVLFAVHTREISNPAPVYLGQESYQSYVRATQLWPSYWATVDFVNSNVPLDAHILGVNLGAGYFFDDPYLTPDMNRDYIYYLAQIAPTDAEKIAWLHAQGYSYLIYDRQVTTWSKQHDPDNLLKPLIQPFQSFLARNLILVATLGETDVYYIPPGAATESG
jgi:4-amino-4-deoxy-L-arabinose transferase-like glycosyltransferase